MKLHARVVLLKTLSKPLYYLILLFSLAVFWRGHNNPGGGFIGGLLATGATLLWAIAHGTISAKHRLPLRNPLYLAACGVLAAAAAGLPSIWHGQGFLHHAWWNVPLPWGELALSTTQLFDLGVYLCVWGGVGGVTLELVALGDEDYWRQHPKQGTEEGGNDASALTALPQPQTEEETA